MYHRPITFGKGLLSSQLRPCTACILKPTVKLTGSSRCTARVGSQKSRVLLGGATETRSIQRRQRD